IIVHEAKRIRRINGKDIEPATFSTGSGALDKGKITGVTRIENDEVLLILDLESVVEDLGIYSPKTLSLIHISEPTRLLSISYAVFCLKKKK
ncbi:hypothetical protein K777_09985, partial [Campylobacter coli CVM 41970]|uniref:chemotaxis protein CheW n=1 Tax=Campylobacter coli TaxID=195 RepID=UPI0007083C22